MLSSLLVSATDISGCFKKIAFHQLLKVLWAACFKIIIATCWFAGQVSVFCKPHINQWKEIVRNIQRCKKLWTADECQFRLCKRYSTHFSLIVHFYPPWKRQKTKRFSDVFRRYRDETLGKNGLSKIAFANSFPTKYRSQHSLNISIQSQSFLWHPDPELKYLVKNLSLPLRHHFSS